MIRIKNVSKSYGDKKIYDNFNLDIEDNRVTCLLGESGCGKTTLLKMISALTPYEGEIECGEKISFVFQEPRLLPNLTVKGNLELVCGDLNRIKGELKKLGLADRLDSRPSELSGGEKQRVALARATLYGGIMLLDEPFASLDLKLKSVLIKDFTQMRLSDNLTAVLVTHDVREAIAAGDRIIVLRGGKILSDIKNQPCGDYFHRTPLENELEKILLNE